MIVEYLAENAPAIAEDWAARLVTAPDILERLPEIGSPVEDAGATGLRELLVGPYRIVYTLRGEDCHILIVFHGRRSIENVLTPEDLQLPND